MSRSANGRREGYGSFGWPSGHGRACPGDPRASRRSLPRRRHCHRGRQPRLPQARQCGSTRVRSGPRCPGANIALTSDAARRTQRLPTLRPARAHRKGTLPPIAIGGLTFAKSFCGLSEPAIVASRDRRPMLRAARDSFREPVPLRNLGREAHDVRADNAGLLHRRLQIRRSEPGPGLRHVGYI